MNGKFDSGNGGNGRNRGRHLRRKQTKVFLSDIHAHDSHSVCGQRPSFVGADGGSTSHGLARVQVAHKIIVGHHFLHRKCKRNGHSKGKTLGNSNNEHGNGGDEKMNKFVPVLAVAPALIPGILHAKVDDKPQNKNAKSHERHKQPDLANQLCQIVQLLLQNANRGILLSLFHLHRRLARDRVWTNSKDKALAIAGNNLASTENERRFLHRPVLSKLGVVFLHVIRLSCHGRLAAHDIGTSQVEAIGWNLVTSFQVKHVADTDVVDRNFNRLIRLPVSKNFAVFGDRR